MFQIVAHLLSSQSSVDDLVFHVLCECFTVKIGELQPGEFVRIFRVLVTVLVFWCFNTSAGF